MNIVDLTYCEWCLDNLDDDKFDYRFDYPVCFDCVEFYSLIPQSE